jgi:hypothetical protein
MKILLASLLTLVSISFCLGSTSWTPFATIENSDEIFCEQLGSIGSPEYNVPSRKRTLETPSYERPAKMRGTVTVPASPSTPTFSSHPAPSLVCNPLNDEVVMSGADFANYSSGEPYSFETFPTVYEEPHISPSQDITDTFFRSLEEPSAPVQQPNSSHVPEASTQPLVEPFSYQPNQAFTNPTQPNMSHANLATSIDFQDYSDHQGVSYSGSGESVPAFQEPRNSSYHDHSSTGIHDLQDPYRQVDSSFTSAVPNSFYNQNYAPSFGGRRDSSYQQPYQQSVSQYPVPTQTKNSFSMSQPAQSFAPVNPIPVQSLLFGNRSPVTNQQTFQGNVARSPILSESPSFGNQPTLSRYPAPNQAIVSANNSISTHPIAHVNPVSIQSLLFNTPSAVRNQQTLQGSVARIPSRFSNQARSQSNQHVARTLNSRAAPIQYTIPLAKPKATVNRKTSRTATPNIQAVHTHINPNEPVNSTLRHQAIDNSSLSTQPIIQSSIQGPANTSASQTSQTISETQTVRSRTDAHVVGRPLFGLSLSTKDINTWLSDVPRRPLSDVDFSNKCIDPEKVHRNKRAHISAWKDALTTLFPMDNSFNEQYFNYSVKKTAVRLGEYLKKFVELGPDPIQHPILNHYKVDLKFLQDGISFLAGLQFCDRIEIGNLHKFVYFVSGVDPKEQKRPATNHALKSIINWIVAISAYFGNNCVSFFTYDLVSDMCSLGLNISIVLDESDSTLQPAVSTVPKKVDVLFREYLDTIYDTARLLFPENIALEQEKEKPQKFNYMEREGIIKSIFREFRLYVEAEAKEPIVNPDYFVDVGRFQLAVANFFATRVIGNYGAHLQKFCVDMNPGHSYGDKAEVTACFVNWMISIATYYGNPNAFKFTYNAVTKTYNLTDRRPSETTSSRLNYT